jgi:hypothetical protein
VTVKYVESTKTVFVEVIATPDSAIVPTYHVVLPKVQPFVIQWSAGFRRHEGKQSGTYLDTLCSSQQSSTIMLSELSVFWVNNEISLHASGDLLCPADIKDQDAWLASIVSICDKCRRNGNNLGLKIRAYHKCLLEKLFLRQFT